MQRGRKYNANTLQLLTLQLSKDRSINMKYLFILCLFLSGCSSEPANEYHFTDRHHVETWKTADGKVMMKSLPDYSYPAELVFTDGAQPIMRD